jgi:type II secretory pathway pseudopilin PulG
VNLSSIQKRAFTVIELLVATAVAIVLAGILIAVTRSALNLWQKSQNRSAANIQAKVALDFIVRDLQSAISRQNQSVFAVDIVAANSLGNNGWLLEHTGPIKPDIVNIFTAEDEVAASNDPIGTSRFGRGGVWLRFLTTNLISDGSSIPGGGYPAFVSYQINRRSVVGSIEPTNTAPVRYTLFREVVSPSNTFDGGYAVTDYDTTLRRPDTDEALCDNVVDFGVWCYTRSGANLTALYPLGAQDSDFRSTAEQFPDVVDVMLRVITDSGAAQLEQIEAGRVTRPHQYNTDDEWWWAVVEAESRVYSSRVIVEGNATP